MQARMISKFIIVQIKKIKERNSKGDFTVADISKIEELWDDNPIDVSAEVTFIWAIANKLRGPYQSDKYKDVIIPMVIIRRFECALKDTRHLRNTVISKKLINTENRGESLSC